MTAKIFKFKIKKKVTYIIINKKTNKNKHYSFPSISMRTTVLPLVIRIAEINPTQIRVINLTTKM